MAWISWAGQSVCSCLSQAFGGGPSSIYRLDFGPFPAYRRLLRTIRCSTWPGCLWTPARGSYSAGRSCAADARPLPSLCASRLSVAAAFRLPGHEGSAHFFLSFVTCCLGVYTLPLASYKLGGLRQASQSLRKKNGFCFLAPFQNLSSLEELEQGWSALYLLNCRKV